MSGGKKIFRRDVTESSATLSDLGSLGEYREEEDGRVYRLVQAGAAVTDGAILRLDSVSASLGNIVEHFAAAQSATPVFGVNQQGQNVAASGYFFCLVKGTCSVRSADIGSDVSMNSMVPVALNSDARIAAFLTAEASAQMNTFGQFIESASRASNATVTGGLYIVGMGA